MTRILYTSAFIPAEWIAAHGLHPVRVTPASERTGPGVLDRQGVCAFVRCYVAEILATAEAAGVVMSTDCDQMRRAFDIVQRNGGPAFLLNRPSTWQSATARTLYGDELRRLGHFLCAQGGTTPSDVRLAETMRQYDEARATLRKLSGHCFAQALAQLDRTGHVEPVPDGSTTQTVNDRIPVALVGGPRRQEDRALFAMIEEHGGTVALDATQGGLGGFCRAFDHRRLGDTPLRELADAYFDSIPDIGRRPNDGFYAWLAPLLQSRHIRAILVQRYLWCDLWHAEVKRLRERFGLPLLDLDLGADTPCDTRRLRTRVGAFMEMLH